MIFHPNSRVEQIQVCKFAFISKSISYYEIDFNNEYTRNIQSGPTTNENKQTFFYFLVLAIIEKTVKKINEQIFLRKIIEIRWNINENILNKKLMN